MMALLVPFVLSARYLRLGPYAGINQAQDQREPTPMLRIHGDCNTLMAHLMAQWAEQQLQNPQRLRPPLHPPIRRHQPEQ